MDRSSNFNGPSVTVTVMLAALALFGVVCRPIAAHPLEAARSSTNSGRDINDNVLGFLTKFGYLPQSDVETGNLRTEDQIREAIKTMQAFAHIPVTGRIDEETKHLMKRPRCGLPDIISDSYRAKRSLQDSSLRTTTAITTARHRHSASRQAGRSKRYTVQGQRWHHTNLTWSLRKGPKASGIDDGHIREQVHKALGLWQSASKLSFTEVNRDDADIRVYFHTNYHNDGYPFDGKGTLLAHAFFPGSGIGGDAHFDDDESWVADHPSKPAELSFFAVAVHEFGHSLGLSHSSVQGAIMYPYYQSLTSEYKLSSDDITGIQAIYGSRNEGGRVTNPALRPSTARPTTTKAEEPTKSPPVTKKPIHPTKPPAPDDKPITCDTSYDAISIIRRELFVFKGRYFWRIGPKGLEASYPVEIDRFWSKLPANLTHIDAIYERPFGQREMIIFIGRQYWNYTNNEHGAGPFPLTKLGLPQELDKLDGALVWGHNGKTYFFSGSMYWRYDEEVGSVELDYPRDMSMWKGVPYNIDAVFQHTNGKTYFFKGKVFWEFNDRRMRVVSTVPSLSAPYWMGCPTGMQTVQEDELRPGEGRYQVIDTVNNAVNPLMQSSTGLVTVLALALSSLSIFLVND